MEKQKPSLEHDTVHGLGFCGESYLTFPLEFRATKLSFTGFWILDTLAFSVKHV